MKLEAFWERLTDTQHSFRQHPGANYSPVIHICTALHLRVIHVFQAGKLTKGCILHTHAEDGISFI